MAIKKKLVDLEATSEEKLEDLSLRPKMLSEYIGQEKLKSNLSIYIEAANKRKDQLDHSLFYGPPGLGKTTLAYIIANELNANIKVTSGPAIEKPADLVQLLSNLQEKDVLFIDEIHRLPKQVEEVLYSAMEDFCIDVVIGTEGNTRAIRIDIPKFTLVGATTRVGLLSNPLRERFGIVSKLEFYTDEELKKIVLRSSKVLNVETDEKGAMEIALRSRGTPRLANRFLKRVRDFAEVKYDGKITENVAKDTLNSLEIDKSGLDVNDREYLSVLCEKFNGGPVGIDNLGVALGEDAGTLEDVIEPFLIMKGLVKRTPRGRVANEGAYQLLGLPFMNRLI